MPMAMIRLHAVVLQREIARWESILSQAAAYPHMDQENRDEHIKGINERMGIKPRPRNEKLERFKTLVGIS